MKMKAITSSDFNNWFTRRRVLALALFYVFASVMAFLVCIDLYNTGQYISKLGDAFIYIGGIYCLSIGVAVFMDAMFRDDE
jgi:hypothetical protein